MFKKYFLPSLLLANFLLCTLLILPYGQSVDDASDEQQLLAALIKTEVARQVSLEDSTQEEPVLEIPSKNLINITVGSVLDNPAVVAQDVSTISTVESDVITDQHDSPKKIYTPVEKVIAKKAAEKVSVEEVEILENEEADVVPTDIAETSETTVHNPEEVVPVVSSENSNTASTSSENSTSSSTTESSSSSTTSSENSTSSSTTTESSSSSTPSSESPSAPAPSSSSEGSSNLENPVFQVFQYSPNNWCVTVKKGGVNSTHCGTTFSALISELNRTCYPGWDYDDLAAEVVSRIQVADMDEFLAAVAESQAYSDQNDVSNAVASAEEAAQYIGTDPISME